MKHPYLLHHISAHLHTFVRGYGAKKTENPEFFGAIVDFTDEPYGDAVPTAKRVRSHRADIPLILSVSGCFAYGWVPLKKNRYLIGPVRFEEEVYFANVLEMKDLGLPEEKPSADFLRTVPLCRFRDFTGDLLLLHNFRKSGEEKEAYLTESELIAASCVPQDEFRRGREDMTSLLFENREIGFVHNPYNHEARERACIQNGDVEELRNVIKEDFTGRYGTLSKDPLKQEFYLGIVAVTVMTRAAIDGGLHPETAFYISDNLIQRMEACSDIQTINHIYRTAEIQLAELVRDLRAEKKEDAPERQNRHISHCKDYIFNHLHDRLTVAEIADAVGLEANYLSALFRRCEGVTLKSYILSEKIKLVKNLLTYSSYSYVKIATYLGFASQSHLGTEFKKSTGMTLKEYRDAYARDDFVHDQMFLPEEVR